MTEHPVFVPFGDEHLAAVINLPPGEPRGLVMLLAGGGGAARSHRFSLWTRVARGLAERGIASVRMDWQGVGDSTGVARFAFTQLPVDQALAVLDMAKRVTGVDRLGIAGNCLGARTSMLVVAREPGIGSAVFMLVKALAGTRKKGAATLRAKSLLKRIPWLVAPAKKLYWRAKGRKGDQIMARIRAVAARADLLVMETLGGRKTGNLSSTIAKMQKEGTGHALELRDLPGGSNRAFQSLERQEYVVGALVDWFDGTFPAGASEPARAGTRSGSPQ